MNLDILVPITFLLVALFALRALLAFRERRSRQLHETLRTALHSGDAVPVAVVRRLADAVDPRRADLRKAILFGVVALALALLGFALPFSDPDGRQVLWSLAIVPTLIGLAHLGLWRFWHRDE